tara:strand:+ start:164 stop:613 length:450 start_codon:yes stop_codon:yes gene_type:complete
MMNQLGVFCMRIKRRQFKKLIKESFDDYEMILKNQYKQQRLDFLVKKLKVLNILEMIQYMMRHVRTIGAAEVLSPGELQEEYNRQFDRILFKEPMITHFHLEGTLSLLTGNKLGKEKAYDLMRSIGIPYPEDYIDEYASILSGYLRAKT